MEAILSGLQIILSVIVIVLILLHSGKDAGLSGAFGVGTGAGPFGGGIVVLGALVAAWPSPEARLRRVRSLYSARVGQELSRA